MLVESVLSPYEAIEAGTRNAAVALGSSLNSAPLKRANALI